MGIFMKTKNNVVLTALFFLAVTSSYGNGMDVPPSSMTQVVDGTRAAMAVVMGYAGIRYLYTVYMQQMHPPTPMPRGFSNPAFRFLSTFFGAAIVQQFTVNVASNPVVMRLWQPPIMLPRQKVSEECNSEDPDQNLLENMKD